MSLKYRDITVPLSGSADVNVTFAAPLRSILILPDTTTVTVSVKPSASSDFIPLAGGRTLTLEMPGESIACPVLTLRASSAVTVHVMVLE